MIGRNSHCLCGSGKKYKKCCLGKKDWEKIIQQPDFTKHLTVRGKNTLFLNGVASILGLDPAQRQFEWSLLKERMTPDRVGKIHQHLAEVWPSADDLERLLKEVGSLSGLYSGTYTPDAIIRSVTRHALYSDSIMLFDPLIYPGSVRPEFDPIIHPEKHVSQTIKGLYIWFSLAPLLSSGILKIIRSPADYDHALRWNSLLEEEDRVKRHPELKELIDKFVKTADIKDGEFGWMTEYFELSLSDEQVFELMKPHGFSKEELDCFLQYRERKKRSHPFYTERRHDELWMATQGECYGMARCVAEMSGAFLLTDNQVRWKMIEIDRREAKVDDSGWEPFASGVQNSALKYLKDISLNDCLKLRSDGLLDRMRSFLRRVWAKSQIGSEFSKATAEQFTAELSDEIAAAEAEWEKIDANLFKWFAGEFAATLAAAPSIGLANAGWLAASLSILGIANLTEAQISRRNLPRRMPGAFFLEPQKKAKPRKC
jgi:hypothetical protein